MAIKRFLVRCYQAEPLIINAAVSLLCAVGVKYGFDVDSNTLLMLLFGGTAATTTVLTRPTVYAPDTVAVERQEAAQRAIQQVQHEQAVKRAAELQAQVHAQQQEVIQDHSPAPAPQQSPFGPAFPRQQQ
jgi:hypothetical protein